MCARCAQAQRGASAHRLQLRRVEAKRLQVGVVIGRQHHAAVLRRKQRVLDAAQVLCRGWRDAERVLQRQRGADAHHHVVRIGERGAGGRCGAWRSAESGQGR